VPLDEFEVNLDKIVTFMKEAGAENVVLITPPPMDEAKYLENFLKPRNRTVTDRNNELLEKYVGKTLNVAEKNSVLCLNSFVELRERGEKSGELLGELFDDGLHLAPKGNQALFEALMDLVAAKIPSLVVRPCPYTGNINSGSVCDALQPFGPWWDQIDPKVQPGTFLKSKKSKK